MYIFAPLGTQGLEYGTLSRVRDNELIDQLFNHIMTEKKQDDGVEDLFSPKIRKVSNSNEANKFVSNLQINKHN